MSKGNNWLTVLIVIGLIGGCLFGQLVLHNADKPVDKDHWTNVIGNLILIRPLMMLIIPLVFVSVICAVTSIGDPSKLGVVGGSTLFYYAATMMIAVGIGAALVTTIRPGELDEESRDALIDQARAAEVEGGDIARNIEEAKQAEHDTLGGAWLNLVQQMIPSNIIRNMSENNTLAVIVVGLLFGLALALGGEKTQPAIAFFNAMFDALMRIVRWIIWLTPIGVFLLVAWTVGKIGLGDLAGKWFKYVLTVLIGLFIHGVIVLPLILSIFSRQNPFRFMWQMRRALLTAFGTDSSTATLPVTIDCAENEGGCSKRAANFVLPLGATINMDGTAIYEAVAVIFLCQLWGIDLSFTEVLIVMVTASMAAIGAAGIPSAGVITMLIVIGAVNQSLLARGVETLPEYLIFVIIAVDRIVDMCRTTVNVWGDAVGAKIISKLAPDPVEELESA